MFISNLHEDIGLANPPACSCVVNAVQAAQMVGHRKHALFYRMRLLNFCLSPKSNSAIVATDSAISDIQNKRK